MDKALRTEWARAIRSARHAAGLTQEQLGRRLGLKGRAVYRWERLDSAPTKRHRRALIVAIQAINPAAANALAGLAASATSAAAPAPAFAATPPVPAVDPAAAFENALFQTADELDLPARQVRRALARLFERLHEANLTLESSRQQLERRIIEMQGT
jgi:transcriptional regulator with XRE-family HTH domain